MEIAIVFMILGAAISASVASGKNRSIGGWALFGALLPLIGIVMICALPPEPATATTGGAAPPA